MLFIRKKRKLKLILTMKKSAKKLSRWNLKKVVKNIKKYEKMRNDYTDSEK